MPHTDIINTFDQLISARESGLPDIAIIPRMLSGGRGRDFQSGWKVWRPGRIVQGAPDCSQFDNDYGCRIFVAWGSTKAKALEEAKGWASEQYKITCWTCNRMFHYVDSRVNKQFPLRKNQ